VGAAFGVIEKCLLPCYGNRRTIQCTNRPDITPARTSLKSSSSGTSFPVGPKCMITEQLHGGKSGALPRTPLGEGARAPYPRPHPRRGRLRRFQFPTILPVRLMLRAPMHRPPTWVQGSALAPPELA
jgi:hypothetical protein